MEKVKTADGKKYWWHAEDASERTCALRYTPGQRCPNCHKGSLAYDGLFMLTCSACGYVAESGAFS